MNREVPIQKMYSIFTDDCVYDKDGSKGHQMYYKTGFNIKEYDVYF